MRVLLHARLAVSCALLLLLGCEEVTQPNESSAEQSPRVELDGRTATIEPLGATLELPQRWLDWHAKFHNSIHRTRAELDAVRTATGDWDAEYAQVLEAALPFTACVFQGGGDGWGRQSNSYLDVQMRVYLPEMTPQQVRERVTTAGLVAAREFSDQAAARQAEFGDWQRTTLSYPLSYGDYGGTAAIDVFARSVAKQTIVLVFMHYADENHGEDEIQAIVRSFHVPQ